MNAFLNSPSSTRKVIRIMASSSVLRRSFGGRLLPLACVATVAESSSGALQAAEGVYDALHAPQSRNNPVLHWNNVAAEAYKPTQGFVPLAQARTFSILHASIHDSLNAIERRYALYTPSLQPAQQASADAAVAAAARLVLVQLIPDQAALIETAFVQALAGVRDGQAKRAVVATGQAAAMATLPAQSADPPPR
jgi:hypothetical protein